MSRALEKRIAPYLDLTYNERDALDRLEQRERRFGAGEVVLAEDGSSGPIFIVGSGWLHSSVRLADGGRQILQFHFVGDLTVAHSIAWLQSAATITAVSECVLHAVPRDALGQLFAQHPRLAAMFYGLAAADHVAVCDRLVSVGRMNGMNRIAALLLELRSRLRIVDGDDGATFQLPLTQQDLGDATGLTKAHVNRSLRAWKETGLIVRRGRLVCITDVAALSARVGFRDRLAVVATDWLPPATLNSDQPHRSHTLI